MYYKTLEKQLFDTFLIIRKSLKEFSKNNKFNKEN